MRNQRPASVQVLATLNIVFGIIALLALCYATVQLLGLPGGEGAQAAATEYWRRLDQVLPSGKYVVALELLVQIALAVALIIGGNGLLKMERWARRWCTVVAIVAPAVRVGDLIYTAQYLEPALENVARHWQRGQRAAQALPSPDLTMTYVVAGIITVLVALYCGTLLVVLYSRTVSAAFAAARPGSPEDRAALWSEDRDARTKKVVGDWGVPAAASQRAGEATSEGKTMHQSEDSTSLENNLNRAAELLRSARRVAVLTGAGVSAESGLATFRGAGGLWEGHRVEDVATPFAFDRDPSLVWRFYNERRANLRTVKPNPGHLALVALEKRLGPEQFALITQNVDGLHRAAGSSHVLELHGNLGRVSCTRCGRIEDRAGEVLEDLPSCRTCRGLLRPDVVWFHEMLPADVWREAESWARSCTCFLVIGTSAVVHPAAGLVQLARREGARVIEVNMTETEASLLAEVHLQGPSGVVLPQLIERLV